MAALGRTPVLPEATPVGALSARSGSSDAAGNPLPTTQCGSSRYASLVPALFGLTALAQHCFLESVGRQPRRRYRPDLEQPPPKKTASELMIGSWKIGGATLDVAFLSRLARSARHGGNGAPRAGKNPPRSPHRRLSRSASSVPEVLRSRPAGRRLDPMVWGPFRY